MMRARFQLLLLLGIVFLASVSVSFASDDSKRKQCLKTCDEERNPRHKQECELSCSLIPDSISLQHKEQGEEDERDEREHQRPRPHKPHHESGDEDRDEEGGQDSESKSPRERNPFHFSSNSFHTLFRNQHGHIRVLQRFDKRSRQLENLRDYRILEFRSKPRTLLLPHHDDAELLLYVISGRAIITFVNPDDRDSYNLERGDAIRIPAGTTFYLVNPEDNENLRIIKLALPVNNPRRIQSFFLSSTDEQQSYLEGFSKNILEASYAARYEEIDRVLFGEESGRKQRQELEGVIVEISNEQIRELRRHAKSSSRKTISSEDEPFNLRSRKPVYSNNYGKLYEITPEKNPQLRDLNVFISVADINQGGLMLPHYHSNAILILAVDEGDLDVELVALRQDQQRQQEEPREVRRYRAELSDDDIFVVPSGYPFVVNATSDLRLLAFGVNAENNQRYFLAGEKDNVLRQLHRPVKDLAFPGSAENFDKLIQKQKGSGFVDAQPQQEQEGRKGKNGPLSSILNALY